MVVVVVVVVLSLVLLVVSFELVELGRSVRQLVRGYLLGVI